MSERIITLEPGQRLTILAAPKPPTPPRMPPTPTRGGGPVPPPDFWRERFPWPPAPPWLEEAWRRRGMPPPVMALPLPAREPAKTQLLGALGLLDMIMARIAALRSRLRGQVDEQYGYQVSFQPLPEDLGVESR